MRTKHLLAALAFLLLCASAAVAQDYSRITQLETAVNGGSATRAQQLELARLYNQVNRFYEASQIANRLLVVDANDAEAVALRDESVRGLHDIQARKVADAEAAAKAPGATDRERLALANAYYEAGSYGAAADTYARVPMAMLDRDTRLRNARSLAWSNRLDAAERAYSQILKEQSTPDVALEYGRLLSWMGASHAAIDSLQASYDRMQTEDALIALANARAWSGDRDRAIRLLDDYVAAHPNATQARQLADQLRASPDLRLERIGRLIALEPYNLALRANRAYLLYDAGRYGESLREIQFVREHSRETVAGLDELEKKDRDQQRAELAKLDERLAALNARADAAMASSTTNPDETLALAKAYSGLEAYDKSITLYDRYLRTRPDDADARIAYARVLTWDERYPAAERQYAMLVAQSPDRADLRYEQAQVQSWNSNFGTAMNSFQQLTDLSSNPRANLYVDVPTKAHYNMGQIYRWYGWNEHAVEEQNAALALDAAYAPARQELDLARHLRPSSNVGATYTYATDSNDFTARRIDLDAQKWTHQNTAFSLGVGRHTFEHADQSVDANVIRAGAMYRYNDRTMLRANGGLNFYNEGLGTRPFIGVGAEFMPNLQSRLAVDVNHYDLVYDVFTLSSLGTPLPGNSVDLRDPISINDVRGHYDFNTGGHWSWLADASYGFISDSNNRAAAQGILSYRFIKEPFIAVKADGHYLRYDFRTPRYWSPNDYRSLAGVLQVGQNIRSRVFWNAEFKYGKSWEGNASSDLRAIEGTVTVPINDVIDAVGNYGYGKSGRLDSVFTSGNDLTNYWQRHWYVGLRVKQLFSRDDRHDNPAYYYDSRPLDGVSSPVVPPLGEVH